MNIEIQFTGKRLLAFGREIPATCEVRNEQNGERKANQVVRTMGQTTPHGLAYYPRQFPPGMWEITRSVEMGKDSEYWPVFIDTAAWQMLRVWEVDEKGHYDKPLMRYVKGRGYGIHHARWNPGPGMVPSRTTLGCINILNPDDAQWLGDEVHQAFGLRQRVWVNVPSWKDWEV